MKKRIKLDPNYERLTHDWAIEFSEILKVEHNPVFDKIIKLTTVTMLYRIADEFENGKYREEILKWFSRGKK